MKDQRKEADLADTQVLEKKPIADIGDDDSDTRQLPALSVEELERVLNKPEK
jgi:hypothetical protein